MWSATKPHTTKLSEQVREGGIYMNIEKFTRKSVTAITDAQNYAKKNGSNQIALEHLALALLTGEDSVAKEILNKTGRIQTGL